ncbi:MAG: hypothetical protein Q7T33_09245 [Dehalococcoidia bacterium]|nr:hypothetical protein [Dehalococcoidia bacterium]
MPRGGRRPGAGAPRGNMNALKHGAYSRQFAQVGALLASDPAVRDALLAMARKHNLKRQRANEVAALLLTRLFEHAQQIARGRPAEEPVLSGPGRSGAPVEGLNLDLPAHDWDSITQAAARLSGGEYGSPQPGASRPIAGPEN